MLKLFIAVVAVALIYWIWTKKNQIVPKKNDESEPFITTIEAIELKTYLDWDTPVSCLKSDGTRYGRQFKNKTVPDLPHEQGCRCETTKLFYTSEDVFQGTSPVTKHKSALGDLCSRDALLLKNILLEIKKETTNVSFEELIEKFDINEFSEEIRKKVLSLAEKAYQQSHSKA
tara:strand:- start:476 stop:994 length:519 start_codon:yes stop_codon:yes gene_type:complete